MSKQILKYLATELVVTKNMVTNIEADINSALEEEAFVEYLHISNQLAFQHDTHSYNVGISNGFTILIKELNGQYEYQVALCRKGENFDRLRGRYFAHLRAQKEGFVKVPKEALYKKAQGSMTQHYANQLSVINFFIKTAHNNVKPIMVPVKDSAVKAALSDFTPDFIGSLADISLGAIGKNLQVHFFKSHNKAFENCFFKPVKDLSEIDYKDAFQRAIEAGQTRVPVTDFGKQNKWYDRYHALYELFKQVTSKNEAN